jgi:hypothetical protein
MTPTRTFPRTCPTPPNHPDTDISYRDMSGLSGSGSQTKRTCPGVSGLSGCVPLQSEAIADTPIGTDGIGHAARQRVIETDEPKVMKSRAVMIREQHRIEGDISAAIAVESIARVRSGITAGKTANGS